MHRQLERERHIREEWHKQQEEEDHKLQEEAHRIAELRSKE